MSAVVVDLKRHRKTSSGDVPELGGVLAQLVGEPFLFARLGYAEELTLHFGTAHPADHLRMRAKGFQYGSHILAVCASAWVLKSTPRSRLILEGLPAGPVASTAKPVAEDAKALISSGGLIQSGSPVTEIVPYEIKEPAGIGLRLETADGSGIVILPVVEIDPETNEEVDFPDWELRTPAGLARIGPGWKWVWEPK